MTAYAFCADENGKLISTHTPLRDVTLIDAKMLAEINISTHTPLRDVTIYWILVLFAIYISTHTPLRDVTFFIDTD